MTTRPRGRPKLKEEERKQRRLESIIKYRQSEKFKLANRKAQKKYYYKKKMLKNKKTTDKFKTKKGNLKKRLAKAKDRLASLEFEEIRPQTDIEAAIDFLNPADQKRLSSVKSEIARLESQLGSYNRFEEFLKTYGDAESEWKRIRKEINSYYK